jgi:hypothetical protein
MCRLPWCTLMECVLGFLLRPDVAATRNLHQCKYFMKGTALIGNYQETAVLRLRQQGWLTCSHILPSPDQHLTCGVTAVTWPPLALNIRHINLLGTQQSSNRGGYVTEGHRSWQDQSIMGRKKRIRETVIAVRITLTKPKLHVPWVSHTKK